jgi:hypothetical protein
MQTPWDELKSKLLELAKQYPEFSASISRNIENHENTESQYEAQILERLNETDWEDLKL